jgi:hypothetical protein
VAESFFDRLFGLATSSTSTSAMPGVLLTAAETAAWFRRHEETDVVHLAHVLLAMIDVQKRLAARGLHVDDAIAVVTQLFEDCSLTEDEERRPTRSAKLAERVQIATHSGVLTTTRLVDALANDLPRELGFVRAPLQASASELGALFDAKLSARGTSLTFDGWDPDLRNCFGLLQKLTDDRWPSWSMTPIALFLALLAYKPYYASLTSRGVDIKALMRDFGESLPKRSTPAPPRPKTLEPSLGPSLYALVLRAERYAAEDSSDVRLRHVLTALHDETEIAAFVDRLAGA